MTCPYCGSSRIEEKIAWTKISDAGGVGLKYEKKKKGPFSLICAATVYSDLCLDCKAIIKSYIDEDTDKDWCHR